MKKRFFMLGILVIVLVFGMMVIGCDFLGGNDDNEPGSNGSGGGGNTGGVGSSRNNARSVSVGYTSSHTINLNGEYWFKYEANGNPVIFETTGNVVDTYMDVYRDTSTSVYSTGGTYDNDSGEGSNALCSYTSTTSGSTYYIKITTRNQTSGTYSFVVKQPTANIRTNPIIVSLGNSSSHIINSSSTHWFRFEGTGNRVFFKTEGNVVNTNISIFAGDNTSSSYSGANPISFFTVSGTTYFISITGNAGTYSFTVQHGDGNGSSRFNAKTVAIGNSTSHNINLNGEHWFTFFGTGNPVTFETTGNVVDTYMEVYRGNNTSVYNTGSSYNDNHTTGNLNARVIYNPSTLGATYFIKVTQRQSTQGTYTFVVE
ncbi:MAG: hypothetical protein FWC06_00165 [Treponema sp.]|nr:hypothetical protein [Treponema sp.]